MKFDYNKSNLEDIIFLLLDLGIITDFHIAGTRLVGIQIKGVDYGDMSDDYNITT